MLEQSDILSIDFYPKKLISVHQLPDGTKATIADNWLLITPSESSIFYEGCSPLTRVVLSYLLGSKSLTQS